MPTLVMQLGHCFRRKGSTGTPGEQDFAVRVGNSAASLLHGRGGWEVKVILADDPLDSYRGDAFAAIHCDGSVSGSARGASVGYQGSTGRTTAREFLAAYQIRGWSGPFRADNYTPALAGYYGVRRAIQVGNRNAFIIESGFLTNEDDRALLVAEGGANRVALAIGDALGIPTDSPAPALRNQEDLMPTADEMRALLRERPYQTVITVSLDPSPIAGAVFVADFDQLVLTHVADIDDYGLFQAMLKNLGITHHYYANQAGAAFSGWKVVAHHLEPKPVAVEIDLDALASKIVDRIGAGLAKTLAGELAARLSA